MDHFNLNAITTIASNREFGTVATSYNPTTDSTLNGTISSAGAAHGFYNFPAAVTSGNYMLIYEISISITASALSNQNILPNNNTVALNLLDGNAISAVGSAGTNCDPILIIGFVTVNGANANVEIVNTYAGGGVITNGDFYVIQLPSPMN